MTQALRKLVTFDEFVAKYPDNSGKRYELHDGVIIEMSQPTGEHEEVIGFLALNISIEIGRLKLPYFIPKTALVKPLENESAYLPDVLVLNRPNLVNEPLWKKDSTASLSKSIPLVIEIVSSNWRDDYLTKVAAYEAVGIPEYWIVDYAALGGRRFIGNPKQPTISVYSLVDGEYQINQFRESERIISPTFRELNLTAEQIFQAGGVQI
ncbi:MAG: Uma2 family endonuclease [Nostoc sp. DedSLP03]|uniref:Uma2 family endonuclease n=1 Tax=Nostoc sp. DedSLP03 TaxID=3075400 RepID=UPI002AD399DD|nr:Uma2 family endonuclease [Nostoc sp. DedSLP03]MDZ7969421.1 Uma2 family endonuclease [Nostoc sp. DedSLP03]